MQRWFLSDLEKCTEEAGICTVLRQNNKKSEKKAFFPSAVTTSLPMQGYESRHCPALVQTQQARKSNHFSKACHTVKGQRFLCT